MLITVKCECLTSVKIDSDFARQQLRWKSEFGFGQHVSDPKAFVMRWLVIVHGWIYVGGRIAKTTLTMTCPKCREKLPGLPVDPEDAAKG